MIWFDLSLRQDLKLWMMYTTKFPMRYRVKASPTFIEWAESLGIDDYEFDSDASQKLFLVKVGFSNPDHALLFKLRWM